MASSNGGRAWLETAWPIIVAVLGLSMAFGASGTIIIGLRGDIGRLQSEIYELHVSDAQQREALGKAVDERNAKLQTLAERISANAELLNADRFIFETLERRLETLEQERRQR